MASVLAALDIELGDRALAAIVMENSLLGYDVVLHRTGYRATRVDLGADRTGELVRLENMRDRRNDFRRRTWRRRRKDDL